jgi:aminoglycoside phosphotransferase (APT) family kinase protein
VTQQHVAGLDLVALADHLEPLLPGGLHGPLRAELVAGGRSNLTYFLDDGRRSWVLRRPPLGHVLETAHDMAREARVIAALADTPVPVPQVISACTDREVLGVPFFVMERVHGTVLRTQEQMAAVPPDVANILGRGLIDVLADLHQVSPAAVGLTDFGRPEGFAARQVRRWTTQLQSSRSRDVPDLDRLGAALAADVPEKQAFSVIHGDYRLDNTVVDLERSGIIAVLDWELAALGDPLLDLGLAYVYWIGWGGIDNPIGGTPGSCPGFPHWDDLVHRYAARTGRDLPPLDWYVAFSFFKVAVLLEGIHFRYVSGMTVGDGFGQIGSMVDPLVDRGRAALAGGAS